MLPGNAIASTMERPTTVKFASVFSIFVNNETPDMISPAAAGRNKPPTTADGVNASTAPALGTKPSTKNIAPAYIIG
ncbi:hypothetical protein D3C84_1177030 [compost metagenome]